MPDKISCIVCDSNLEFKTFKGGGEVAGLTNTIVHGPSFARILAVEDRMSVWKCDLKA